MILKAIIRSSFAKVKPLKVTGKVSANGVQFNSGTSSHTFQVDNPLETLIASLAACELSTLRALSKGSNLKIKDARFTTIESGLDIEKFMKGGPENKLEEIKIEAEIETNVSQEELLKWISKAENSCPIYQMLKQAGVKGKIKLFCQNFNNKSNQLEKYLFDISQKIKYIILFDFFFLSNFCNIINEVNIFFSLCNFRKGFFKNNSIAFQIRNDKFF